MTTKDIWIVGNRFTFGGPNGPRGIVVLKSSNQITVEWEKDSSRNNFTTAFFREYAHVDPRPLAARGMRDICRSYRLRWVVAE